MIDMVDSTASDCYFQVQYKANYVAVLDEVKFFVNRLQDKTLRRQPRLPGLRRRNNVHGSLDN